MADPTNEDAARALDRLTSPEAPTPQPKPRPAPTVNPKPQRPGAPTAVPKVARPAGAKVKPAPTSATPDLQQVLAQSRSSSSGAPTTSRSKSDAALSGLKLKRTFIPVLLTGGFILISLAVVHFAWKSDDNPVVEMPMFIIVLMLVAGLLSWGLAAINMMSVRRTLAARS